MAYLVLARKYRPQTFGEMTGQEHVVRTLSNALERGQLAHAFLFTGPRGVGKTTAARLVAKAVNCEKGPTAQPCGRCVPCVEIAEGRAVDVVEIDAASNTGVDNVRDIIEAVKYRPARDRYKVYVIDEVHMLSMGAFNALLKTLEEPPAHVLFVLATTDVHKVPETIISRCQRFDFRRLTLQQIVEQLRKVAEPEGIRLSDSSLALVARAAEGGMRDALSLLDRVRAACGDAPGDAEVAEAVGAVDAASVGRIAWALLRRDGAALLAEVQSLFDRGQEMKRVAEEVVRRLRDLTVAKLAPAVPLDLPDAERREVEEQSAAAGAGQLARLFDIAQRSVVEVKLAEQPRYALEVALLKGALLAPGADVADLIARVEELTGGTPPTGAAPAAGPGSAPSRGSSRPAPPSGSPPASPAGEQAKGQPDEAAPERAGGVGGRSFSATPQVQGPKGQPDEAAPERAGGVGGRSFSATPQVQGPKGQPDEAAPERAGDSDASDRWRAAVAEVEKVSPSVAPQLKQGALVALREGEVRLRFPEGTHFASLVQRKRAEVEAAFARFFGRPTRLVIETGPMPQVDPPGGTASLAAVEQAEKEARAARVREAARGHPGIQEAARALGADVAKVEEL